MSIKKQSRNCGNCPRCVDEQGNRKDAAPHGPYYEYRLYIGSSPPPAWLREELARIEERVAEWRERKGEGD